MLTGKFFGTPQLWLHDICISQSLTKKEMALLIYLIITGRPQQWSTLTELLWETNMSKRQQYLSQAKLHYLLWRLPKPIRAYLRCSRQTVQFNNQSPYWCDVISFLNCIAKAETISHPSLREQTMNLYQETFLNEFIVEDAPSFNQWLQNKRQELGEQRRKVGSCSTPFVKVGEESSQELAKRKN